jgi:hypothetical protein
MVSLIVLTETKTDRSRNRSVGSAVLPDSACAPLESKHFGI